MSEHQCFREAADRVWEIAKEYEKKGLKDLEEELKALADQLHNSARQLEKESKDK